MCGIVGYIGPKSVVPVIIEGLRRLEYRGYDSAGIAVGGAPAAKHSPAAPSALALRRAPGKLRNLEAVIAASPIEGTYGIGHTRWATHGRPTEENAHPHRDGTGTLVVVHNGIVENYLQLKQALIAKGHKFQSETDTEIIAHLIQDELELAVPRTHQQNCHPERSRGTCFSHGRGKQCRGCHRSHRHLARSASARAASTRRSRPSRRQAPHRRLRHRRPLRPRPRYPRRRPHGASCSNRYR